VNGKTISVRPLTEIREEIDRLAEQRSGLLRLLAEYPDAAGALERRCLDARIAALWDEQRATRARMRFGTRSSIVERARRSERILRSETRGRAA
jgi:hypothetical protein